MLHALIGVLFAVGSFFVLADCFAVPYYKTSKAVWSLAKRQKEKTSAVDLWLGSIAEWLSHHLPISEWKRAQLAADLQTAQIPVTPERYKANAIIRACIVGVLAVPAFFLFPIASGLILFAAVFLYRRESGAVGRAVQKKREEIEGALPRLVFTIEKTLKHSRDVLEMLESAIPYTGGALARELTVTAADMRSGNEESAITRLETRVGSPMMSDVCRGLIALLRGDDTAVYWAALSVKFQDHARQQLRARALKVPGKVRKLSMCLLVCFMLIYIVVIIEEISISLGVLFQ